MKITNKSETEGTFEITFRRIRSQKEYDNVFKNLPPDHFTEIFRVVDPESFKPLILFRVKDQNQLNTFYMVEEIPNVT